MSAVEDAATAGLEVYIVGGAVRDALLGLPAGDRDWVVVGATPQDMVRRGFIPVGGDFPVFLHPLSKEEYALARTERKSGRGYKGFTFYTGTDVSLEQDLRRRDFTVNAMARTQQGELVDPLNGQADLRARCFRHVGAAFAEDPVRILRLGRFAARFADFSVAAETQALCRQMVDEGEVDALVPERVWKELSRGLMEAVPSRMLQIWDACGALSRVLPQLRQWHSVAGDLDAAARRGLALPGRYALLARLSPERETLATRLRVPGDCADQARLLPLVLQALPAASASERLDVIERCDGLRKPDRFLALVEAASVVSQVDIAPWSRALAAVRGIDAGAIARQCSGDAVRIKAALRHARLAALQVAA
ncbi:tRNA CCA-pyrophosphorylase [Bordetella holmesii]|uniref:tRNA nucleotidyltransferase/poly(A) polymerase family protein n=2 Tax=Bordetella holmesii TaxID=35814 RepID=A0A158M1S9_9BORD|nr:tRNA CCA-pyrophosphorylase [Bordetella holmesii]AHV93867.1 poly A polymerase head domain protein [Bordetella holmesii ATCC 51541]AIT25908.1 poly A polymerase head domain protein [Bordetella holmesii 44057]EWM41683.1 poly A polymerase head domain protein [Bordetella holmesii 41130]EWM46476.1 poly A polymerase head domain protein [Bordetella holmesii 35009]EWM50642.1 poly A polymerase head domain protein [Bordetella holmesii 70147]